MTKLISIVFWALLIIFGILVFLYGFSGAVIIVAVFFELLLN